MAEEAGQECYFWDTYPWITTDNNNSGGGGGGGTGDQDKQGGVNKALDSNKSNQMQQAEKGSSGGAGGGCDQAGGGKKKGGGGEKKNGKESVDDKGKGEEMPTDDHEIHIWTERERRKKMRNMFSQLHALLPQLPPKADKSTIVDEAVNHIKKLEQTLQNLQKQKLEKIHGKSTNAGAATFIHPQKLAIGTRESFLADQGSTTNNLPGPSSTTFSFPQCLSTNFKTWTSPNITLNVCGLDAHICICSGKKPGLFTAICFVLEKHKLEIVSAQVSSDHSRCMYMIHAHANAPNQLADTFPCDEIYKQAAAEIMLWFN